MRGDSALPCSNELSVQLSDDSPLGRNGMEFNHFGARGRAVAARPTKPATHRCAPCRRGRTLSERHAELFDKHLRGNGEGECPGRIVGRRVWVRCAVRNAPGRLQTVEWVGPPTPGGRDRGGHFREAAGADGRFLHANGRPAPRLLALAIRAC